MKKIYFFIFIIASVVMLSQYQTVDAQVFDCTDFVEGGNTATADWGHPCGVPGSGQDHLEIKCQVKSTSISGAQEEMICTTNQFNPCASNVCLQRVGGGRCFFVFLFFFAPPQGG